MKLSERFHVGLDFFEFLRGTNRSTLTDRNELGDVYNFEFRNRDSRTKDPNFSSVLYALKISGRIRIRKNNIRFYAKVTGLHIDQWYSPREYYPRSTRNAVTRNGPVWSPETGVRDRRKLASLLMKRLKKERGNFISNKHGVTVTADPDFNNGKLDLCVENTYEYTVVLKVKNSGPDVVYFTYYTPLQWLKYFTVSDELKVTKANPLTLQPGHSYDITGHFRCDLIGYYPTTLAFEFKPDLEPSTPAFHIVRFIAARCISSLGMELAPTAPFTPRCLPARTPEIDCTIVDGQRPEGMSVVRLEMKVPLHNYNVPSYINQLVETLRKPGSGRDIRRGILESPLCWQNYAEKFKLMLYLEELQMKVDIRRYNIPNRETTEPIPMFRDKFNKKLLVLEVAGVSENRPSVLRGDQLLVRREGETDVKYRGYVHSVELNSVKLGFSSELLSGFVDGMRFSVEFVFNRLILRLQHRAAEMAVKHGLKRVLFPAEDSVPASSVELPDLTLCDRKLQDNTEQYQAVQHIVAGSSKPAPYLVFGPPGTGKTVTLVEAIKQIEKTQTSCRILACAPSNSAADLLCDKILDHVDQRKVYRMYASSRDPKTVPEKLKPCSNLVGDCYVYPPKDDLLEYRVMVTTLLTAGRLVTGGIPAGHYTHVFVDEAGHAVEVECLVPLAGLLDAQTGQVVLAGDPKQLGPILRSPFALKYGMGVSLLERMMTNFPLYQKREGAFDNCFVTKLLRNYRSHPAILKVPNELFYDGELLCHADPVLSHSYCGWEYLPPAAKLKNFPLIFHGVTGLEEREATSPSFFNRTEVEVLMDYVKKLLQTHSKKGRATIAPKDIGIIAPYRKQVQKIRQALNKLEKDLKWKTMSSLKVGSVEEFQGQERRVILVSAVRSSPEYADFDRDFNLGFVKNDKRFNVALTRAKALLIVVGNPTVLNTDPTWAHFIKYCSDSGGYGGFRPDSIVTEDVEGLVERLACLCVDMRVTETAESAVQQHIDPQWRSDL
ncbi:putative helicase mov-10-B.1 [Cynoglossus semilaevis]|uniref:RNA helicase n=1 Tax=Cynoglossus semilaevis TaxID=244447 RepID=A0A3P8VNH1_CYNSE|nr:putative helicase MOV-10 [Cynoglossus semilaevis]